MKHLKRRSFLSGLLALPAAALPFKAMAKEPEVITLTWMTRSYMPQAPEDIAEVGHQYDWVEVRQEIVVTDDDLKRELRSFPLRPRN